MNIEFYRLKENQLVKDEVTFNSTAKYYRIEAAKGYYLPKELKLFFTYEHKKLNFFAQGTPPYKLYYGSLSEKREQTDFSSLAITPVKATFGEEKVMNADALKVPDAPRNSSAVWVWISLVVGVMVLGFMSYKLLKEAKAT